VYQVTKNFGTVEEAGGRDIHIHMVQRVRCAGVKQASGDRETTWDCD
jgi:cold shock CspA family protein